MLKVMQVTADLNFQRVTWPLGRIEQTDVIPRPMFYGRPMGAHWSSTWGGKITDPYQPRGSFFDAFLGTFGLFPQSLEIFSALLESVGELLPIVVEDVGECAIANITLVAGGAFDKENGVKRILDGLVFEPIKYAFHASVVAPLTLFKIPEIRSDILCVSGGAVAPDRDFFRLYQDHGLSGLKFKTVWEEER